MISSKVLKAEVLYTYGEMLDVRCLQQYWNEWGGLPPMTVCEAVRAIKSLRRARRLGMLPLRIDYDHEVVRDIVLVRRGIDLRQHFQIKERRKIASVRYADGRIVVGDQYIGLGMKLCVRDLTEEIVRVALEM